MKKSDEQFWKQQVEAWKDSGLSIKKFCRMEGLIEHQFYRWKKIILSSASSADFIEAKDKSSVATQFTITLPNQMRLSFDRLPDAAWLGGVLRIFGESRASQS